MQSDHEPINWAISTFEIAVEYAPYAILLVTDGGRIAYANQQTERLLGYERSALLGQQLEILLPERFRGRHPDMRTMFMQHPSPRTMGSGRDLYALHRDGTEIQVEIGLNPIRTLDGPMIQTSIIDITERKVQEAIIRKQMIELEARHRDMEQFTYIASHDLQEPLRTITNYIQILEEDFRHDPVTSRYMKAIDQSARRMRMLVKGLLDFARLGSGQTLVEADCSSIVADVISDLQTLIRSSGTIIHLTGSMPRLYVYETEMHQLFQNLITNAIKFARPEVSPEITIDCRRVDLDWEFAVRDNGIGIDPRYHDRIFNIFQRLHPEQLYEGHGIGLANCKKIIELHGGTIRVDSEPGSGSTFYFTIPDIKI